MSKLLHVKSLSQLHQMVGCEPPRHPAISMLRHAETSFPTGLDQFTGAVTEFYIISLKTEKGSLKYGRSYYDFEEGSMIFTAPNQMLFPTHLEKDISTLEGWSLFFHPDLLHQFDLAKRMHEYSYFDYEFNEALHLSDQEKVKINTCVDNLVEEYSQNIDQHTQGLIISNLELLLNYCKRFYDRQFYTRSKPNKDIVSRVENLLIDYFNSDLPTSRGLPTVKYCADRVNLSPNYLSDLLKKQTGKNTKEHIDYYLLKKAKMMLLNSELTINEIAFDLGFEYPKSLGKLFKKKMGITPNEYRHAQ